MPRRVRLPDPSREEQCTTCRQFFPATFEYFPPQKRRRGTYLHSQCRPCHRLNGAKYREQHPEESRAASRQYYVKNPTYRSEYRHKNRAQMQGYCRTYSKRHPGKIAAKSRNRRARVRQSSGSHTAEDIQIQYQAQAGRCWWCGKKLKRYHVDHRVPIAKGGTNDPANLCLACPSCNARKSDKLPGEFNGRLL